MDKHNQDHIVCFGHDWPFVITPAENRHDVPQTTPVVEYVMTVLPASALGLHSVSTALFNRIVQLAQSGKRGVPFDHSLAAWAFVNGVALDVFSQNGAPRIRPDDKLTILFAQPDREPEEVAVQTKPKRKRRRTTV